MEYGQKYLISSSRAIRLTARLAVMVPFAALLLSPLPALAINLGTADGFAVLGASVVTCTSAAVNGNVGVDFGGAVAQTSCTISGGTVHEGDTVAQQAYDDFLVAYADLAAEPCGTFLTGLSGRTLPPGVYCVALATTEAGVLTLDGLSTDTWIFKIGTSGIGALTGTGFSVVMPGGQTCHNNVFWWTAQATTMTDSFFLGSILAGTSITVTRGSLDGQALAKVAVTLTGPSVCGPDGLPPTVSVTAPSAGATVSGTTPVTASASDNVGVVGVQFRLDGVNLGAEDTTSPYGVSWNTTTAASGSHTLTAVARDAAGNTATSIGIAALVLSPPPAFSGNLGTADGFAVLGASVVTCTSAAVNGNVGVDFGGAVAQTSCTISGGTVHEGDTVAQQAYDDFLVAYAAVAAEPCGTFLTGLSGRTLLPGVYCVALATTEAGVLTLDGLSTDTWIFKIGTSGIGALTGTGFSVVMPGGQTCNNNVFWWTAQATTMTDSVFLGSILAGTSITVTRGSLDGQALAKVAVTLTGPSVCGPQEPQDALPPTVSVTAPSAGATVSGTVTVTASASDNVGVAGVRFFVDGGALGVEDTVAPYAVAWDTATVATGSHTVTAVARDVAGNTAASGPVTVTVSQTVTRFEDTDLSSTYTDGVTAPGQPAGWWHGSRSRAWSAKIASFNRSQGARARFRFTGTTVRWIGFRSPWSGIARVYVDDVFVTELDLYATTEQVQAVVFSTTGLTNGTHTLTVESTGRKNTASADYAVVVDAFEVSPASPPPVVGTRGEETALSLSAGWAPDSQPVRSWSGGAAAISATPGAQATFSFVGTEVRWIGLRGPQTGIARVYVDGAFDAEVDTYAATETQAVIYTATGLAAGRHALRIDVTGQRNAASTNSYIAVDAVDARGRIEDPDPSIAFTGDWRRDNFDKAWSGTSPNTGSGSTALSRTAGVQATVAFNGTAASWIGLRSPATGIARVLVDGAYVADVDTYAPAEDIQAVLYTATGLANGPHTMTVEVTGQRNAASIDSLVVVDAFDVRFSSSAPQITRFQETDSTIYTGSWNQGTRFNYWAGETAAFSGSAGARAAFTFTGTAVRWIGQHSFNGGIARVLLDGVEAAQVDTFAPIQEEFHAVMFSATDLGSGSHTLTIEATGQKAPLAQGNWVIVDAFDFY